MGNQYENCLPTCQVRFIQQLVDQLNQGSGVGDGRNYWWCDTLCVPLGAASQELRKQAIREMRHTYTNAACVLALDSELMNISVNIPPVEMYIRLKLSSWARRVWTLQEANLARSVMVQWSDATRTLGQIHEGVLRDGQRDERSLYTRYSFLARTFFAPFHHQQQELPMPRRMIDMWKQLQWRGTSRQADESVCLATIVGIDPGPILAISKTNLDGRMAKFLELARTIPYVLLIQPPPRVSQSGFQWAPSSLLNCFRSNATNPFRMVPGIGIIDQEARGLRIERPGVMLSLERPESLSVFQWSGEIFSVTVDQSSASADMYRVLYLFPQDQQRLRVSETRRTGRPVIIFLEAESLPLGAKGMCVLGEILDGQAEDLPRVNFVTIVTMQASVSSQDTEVHTVCSFEKVPKQNWLLI